MIKNVGLVAFVVAVIAILVIGGINRTNVILGRGETQFDMHTYSGQPRQLTADRNSTSAFRGQRGQAAGRQQGGQAESFRKEQPWAAEWLTLEGIAKSVDDNTLIVATTSGETISVQNRAWWYAQEQGVRVAVGDSLRLSGFFDSLNGEFETARIENLTSGQIIRLRDENGRPLWSGRGRGG